MERRNRDGKEKVNHGCPVLRPTWWDRVLEIVAGILAVVLMGLSLAIYLHSPGQIPIHFNYRGEADGWGVLPWFLSLPDWVWSSWSFVQRLPITGRWYICPFA